MQHEWDAQVSERQVHNGAPQVLDDRRLLLDVASDWCRRTLPEVDLQAGGASEELLDLLNSQDVFRRGVTEENHVVGVEGDDRDHAARVGLLQDAKLDRATEDAVFTARTKSCRDKGSPWWSLRRCQITGPGAPLRSTFMLGDDKSTVSQLRKRSLKL